MFGILGHLAPVHRCARSVPCAVCAVSWATWLLFTGIPVKPSDEHGDETQNIVSLQTVIDVYHKCDKSLQIKQYQIIQCMYMRPMGWSGYTPPLK